MSAAQPTIAASPFDDPAADLIIQSSDNVRFYVYKLILSLASPVFADMFTLPEPPKKNPHDCDHHPVVPVSESSIVLHRLLSWCDPRCNPSLGSAEEIPTMLEVADKYCLDKMIRHAGDILLLSTLYVEKEPMKVFAIAVRYRLTDVAKFAAKCTLRFTWEEQVERDTPELRHIPAIALRQLEAYQLACKRIATGALVGNPSWLKNFPPVSSLRRPGQPCSNGRVTPSGFPTWRCWLSKYVNSVNEEVYKRPLAPTIVPDLLPTISDMSKCPQCPSLDSKIISQFNEHLIEEIDRLVSQVRLKLDY
ncbi:hypothetical protein DFH09DRAFT_543100 [Mycena vulgaris]|nr:hypothetical protein DFH09DRAFT_543100 [Mycena vulgaris]